MIDQLFILATFVGTAIGWFILADSDFSDSALVRWFFRVGGGVWAAVAIAMTVALVPAVMVSMSTCSDADAPWWLYYSVGCWLP